MRFSFAYKYFPSQSYWMMKTGHRNIIGIIRAAGIGTISLLSIPVIGNLKLPGLIMS
ncbi:MAG: hypothetical protein JRF35_11600 [Deltaproteobacteria bacterium]|nr:hypothetical protein [Deltaproteobacteria bacterium]